MEIWKWAGTAGCALALLACPDSGLAMPAAGGGVAQAPPATEAQGSSAPAAAPAAAAPLTPEKALAQAQNLIGKKKREEALALLEPLAQSEDPAVKWPALFWSARAHYEERRTRTAALLWAEVAASYEPLAADAEYWQGQAYLRRARYRTARECFARAAERATNDNLKRQCLYQVAYTHYLERHYDEAARLLEDLQRAYPDTPQAKSAASLLKTSEMRRHDARRVTLQWTAGLGVATTSQILRFNTPPEIGLGANAQLGGSLRWEPRDGMRITSSVYGTRVKYVVGGIHDRQGIVANLSSSHDLGDARSVSYGISYSTNQTLDLVNSDSITYGVNGSYRRPFGFNGSLGLSLGLSRLRYTSALSSGYQGTLSSYYYEPITPTVSLTCGLGCTRSVVKASHLSYTGLSGSLGLRKRLGKSLSIGGGYSYGNSDFDAAAPRQKYVRYDQTHRIYCEATQRVIGSVAVTVGWEQTRRRSNSRYVNSILPSWYLRTSRLFEFKL